MMRFKITRTSQWKDGRHTWQKPHPRAVSAMDREQVYWFIDVINLEDLLSLTKEEGLDIIVIARKFLDCVGVIEFYDDHRE